jgi:hypothetical protein
VVGDESRSTVAARVTGITAWNGGAKRRAANWPSDRRRQPSWGELPAR